MTLCPYYDVTRPFRLMEKEIIRPDVFGYPLRENMMKPMERLASAMNQMAIQDMGSSITTNKEKFEVNVDVQHFAPEEIDVRVVDRYVTIEGKHDEKQDHHGYISRRFVRRYALPQGCLPDTVESKLSSDGVLTVTAPRVLALPSSGERIIPIIHTGPVKKQISSPTFEAKES